MMIRLRACLFLWGLFFSVLAFTQITIWDGTSWDSGEPNATIDAQISGNLLLSQMSGNEVVCRSLTIDAGVTITYDLDNGLIHTNADPVGIPALTINSTTPVAVNPGITGCVFKITTHLGGTATLMPGATPLKVCNGLQLFVNKPSPSAGEVGEGDDFVFESGAVYYNEAAKLDGIVGNVIVNQTGNSSTTAYNLWSLPNQDGNTINSIFSTPGIAYSFTDGGTDATAWNSVATSAMSTGVGYMITGQSSNTYAFTGAVTVQAVITVSTSATGYKLVGNPYACFLDLHNGSSGFFDVNTHLTGTAYFWIDDLSTGSGYTTADWASWNSSGTVTANSVTPAGNVAVAQGFFVDVSSASDVTFRSDMLTVTKEDFHKKPAPDIQRFWLNIIDSSGNYSETLLAFTDSASTGFDRCYDGRKSLVHGNMAIYTDLQGEPYMIQAYPKLVSSQIIPLGVITNDDGDFTFNLKAADNLPAGASLVLEDQYTNTFHHLDSSDYIVNLQQDTFDNRFFIHVNMMATDLEEVSTQDLIYVYHNNGIANVSGLRNCGQINTIEVYDLSGRMISNSIINRELSDFAIEQQSKGVYFIRIESEAGAFVKKIFI